MTLPRQNEHGINLTEPFQSVIYPETGHVYYDEQKQKMIDWFNPHLGGGQS